MSTDPAGARVRRLLAGPVGCAFFLAARQASLTVQRLLVPEVSLDLAAKARAALDPWTGYAAAARAEVLARAAEVGDLASSAAHDPRSAWWWQRLPAQSQVSLVGAEPEPPPTTAASWAAYAQRPAAAFFTATRFGSTSGLHAALANQVGDWEPAYPLLEEDIEVSAEARVYEVNNAADWHELAARSPSTVHRRGSGPPGIHDDAAPDWSAVARRWDGVHLTFAGLLAASFTPATTAAGTTTLWTWESERTLWLRQPFLARRPVRRVTEEIRSGDPGHAVRLSSAEPSGTRDRGWLRRRPGPRARGESNVPDMGDR